MDYFIILLYDVGYIDHFFHQEYLGLIIMLPFFYMRDQCLYLMETYFNVVCGGEGEVEIGILVEPLGK